jgi:RNA polymerase primary sigma factor
VRAACAGGAVFSLFFPWKKPVSRPRRSRGHTAQATPASYRRAIVDTALLSADEEKELARRIEDGDSAARERMIHANLRLVVNIARSYLGRGLSRHDLIEEGNLGLLHAVERFDPAMNARFSTYASYWITRFIKQALINYGKTIRIPAYMMNLLAKWRRAGSELTDEFGRPPSNEEIARSLNLSKKKLAIIKKAIDVCNADRPMEGRGTHWSLDELITDRSSKAPDIALVEADDIKRLRELLGKMAEREATVLRMRFGLDGGESKTLEEIGVHLGLTRERVRQIECAALATLYERMQGG